jgi:diguanylate cyclase (GGDEF)-like protein
MPNQDPELQELYGEAARRGLFAQDKEMEQIGHEMRARGMVVDKTQGGLFPEQPRRSGPPVLPPTAGLDISLPSGNPIQMRQALPKWRGSFGQGDTGATVRVPGIQPAPTAGTTPKPVSQGVSFVKRPPIKATPTKTVTKPSVGVGDIRQREADQAELDARSKNPFTYPEERHPVPTPQQPGFFGRIAQGVQHLVGALNPAGITTERVTTGVPTARRLLMTTGDYPALPVIRNKTAAERLRLIAEKNAVVEAVRVLRDAIQPNGQIDWKKAPTDPNLSIQRTAVLPTIQKLTPWQKKLLPIVQQQFRAEDKASQMAGVGEGIIQDALAAVAGFKVGGFVGNKARQLALQKLAPYLSEPAFEVLSDRVAALAGKKAPTQLPQVVARTAARVVPTLAGGTAGGAAGGGAAGFTVGLAQTGDVRKAVEAGVEGVKQGAKFGAVAATLHLAVENAVSGLKTYRTGETEAHVETIGNTLGKKLGLTPDETSALKGRLVEIAKAPAVRKNSMREQLVQDLKAGRPASVKTPPVETPPPSPKPAPPPSPGPTVHAPEGEVALRYQTPEQMANLSQRVQAGEITGEPATQITQWTRAHEAWNDIALDPADSQRFTREWHNPANPIRQQWNVVSTAATRATDPELAAKLRAAADDIAKGYARTFSPTETPAIPPTVSVWRQMSPAQQAAVPTEAKAALLKNDIANSSLVLHGVAPEAKEFRGIRSVKQLNAYADEMFGQAQDRLASEQPEKIETGYGKPTDELLNAPTPGLDAIHRGYEQATQPPREINITPLDETAERARLIDEIAQTRDGPAPYFPPSWSMDELREYHAGVMARPAPTENTYTGPERRQNSEQRRRVSEMSPEEMQKALLEHPLTGLPNKRAFDENAGNYSHFGFTDLDNFKWFNDTFSHTEGDKVLRAVGEVIKSVAPDTFHISGDEFILAGHDPADIGAKLENISEQLSKTPIELTDSHGTTVIIDGVGMSYGIGRNKDEAEVGLHGHKEERRLAGKRVAREKSGGTQTARGQRAVRSEERGQGKSQELKARTVELTESKPAAAPKIKEGAFVRDEKTRTTYGLIAREEGKWIAVADPMKADLSTPRVKLSDADIAGMRVVRDAAEASKASTPKQKFLAELENEGAGFNASTTATVAANFKEVLQARTGKPLTLTGFRQEARGGRVPGTGTFHAIDPQIAAEYGAGYGNVAKGEKARGGPIESLKVEKLSFENPLVIDGTHERLARDVRDGKLFQGIPEPARKAILAGWDHLQKHGEPGIPLFNKAVARAARLAGHDGIFYRSLTKDLSLGTKGNASEVVDLRGVRSSAPTPESGRKGGSVHRSDSVQAGGHDYHIVGQAKHGENAGKFVALDKATGKTVYLDASEAKAGQTPESGSKGGQVGQGNFTDPELNAWTRENYGKPVETETRLDKFKAAMTELGHLATREYRDLARTGEWGNVTQLLKRLEKASEIANSETQIRMARIVNELSPEENSMFRDSLILRDMAEDIKRQEDEIARGALDELRLPIPWTPEKVERETQTIDAMVAKSPKVRAALKQRPLEMAEVTSEYEKEYTRAFGKPPSLTRGDSYYRHQILDIADAGYSRGGTLGGFKAPSDKPGYLKKRQGSERGYNTKYIEAEHDWMSKNDPRHDRAQGVQRGQGIRHRQVAQASCHRSERSRGAGEDRSRRHRPVGKARRRR